FNLDKNSNVITKVTNPTPSIEVRKIRRQSLTKANITDKQPISNKHLVTNESVTIKMKRTVPLESWEFFHLHNLIV
ncbi:unnamed protein product, partial [Rotaria sp. Silwood1]